MDNMGWYILFEEESRMIEKVAFYLGINGETPNIALAEELCETEDKVGVREIAQGLSNDNQLIAGDCIKVLYEIGSRRPQLIVDYVEEFIYLLGSPNNRLVWGAMTALSFIAPLKPDEIHASLDAVVKAYEEGSVITRDRAISVFAYLSKEDKEYEKELFSLIITHLKACRTKEVLQHAERAFVCVNESNAQEFKGVLLDRKKHMTETQKKRTDKIIKKIDSCKFAD